MSTDSGSTASFSEPDPALAGQLAPLVAAAHSALLTLDDGPQRREGEQVLDLVDRFLKGEPIPPRTLEDTLLDEDDHGLLIYEQSAGSERSEAIWSAVTGVVGYAAWLAYKQAGKPPGALVENFDLPESLDMVTDLVRKAGTVAS
jgi:hypothetical protein